MKYIKLFEQYSKTYQINEGVIKLTPDEKAQVNNLVLKIEEIIISNDFSNANVKVKGPVGSEDEIKSIDCIELAEFKYLFADKKPGVLKVYISDCKSVPENLRNGLGYAWYRPNDPKNLEDGQVVINASEFSSNLQNKYEEKHREKLRSVLTHEIIHAKDPNYNHIKGKDEINKDYSLRDEEIKAFTAQFIDLIENKVEKWIEVNKDKMNDTGKQNEVDMIGQILNNLLLIFSRQLSHDSLNRNISEFIEDFNLNIANLNKTFKFGTDEFENFNRVNGFSVLSAVVGRLIEIKKGEPKRYKKFINALYKSISKIFDEVNNSIKGTKLKPIKIETDLDKINYSW